MLNQVIIVGRLAKDVEVKEENGKKVTNMTLAVPRSFKNVEGVYDTDFIDILVFDNIATSTNEYCKKGDVVGVKGRIQTKIIEKEDKTKIKQMEIIAEKMTFLSSKKTDEEQ